MTPRINRDRLLGRLETFNRIGALPGGGNCRLALSDHDRAGRETCSCNGWASSASR